VPIAQRFIAMNQRQARIQAVSDWLMEFSVLWAVFPLLDQLLENRPIRPAFTAMSIGIAALAALGGILLRKGEPR
jgi:hypothetical protein